MANTKITKKTRLFYRSLTTKPCKLITESDRRESIINKLKTLKQEEKKKIVVGLSASLRCLKKKLPTAIILDSTIPKQIALFITEYSNKIPIPVIQIENLNEAVGHPALVISVLDKDNSLLDLLSSYNTNST